MGRSENMLAGFIRSAGRFPNRTALVVGNEVLSYESLSRLSADIAAAVDQFAAPSENFCGIFAYKTKFAYAGILGILGTGRGYMPLNPNFPVERSKRMILLSGVETLVCSSEAIVALEAILNTLAKPLTILLCDSEPDLLQRRYPHHRFASIHLNRAERLSNPATDPQKAAYLLFTSGSTGDPKGIAIPHRGIRWYIRHLDKVYDCINEKDRFSQVFDPTFDASIHDMFFCWEKGAALYCVPKNLILAPSRFIHDRGLTVWCSVPSLAASLSNLKLLKNNCFSKLRLSIFCGEALSQSLAEEWHQAAPNSIIDNLYGPTEASVLISSYRWDPEKSPSRCENGVVPVGWIFDGNEACLVNSKMEPVGKGEIGEMCLSGPQVASGYFQNPTLTFRSFIHIGNRGDRLWYRTGDLLREGEDGCYTFFGRIDDQVQIRGYRVELQEINYVLQQAAGTHYAVAVPWPLIAGRADEVHAFISNSAKTEAEIIDHCKRFLPGYMIPRRIHFLSVMPLNQNGKIDRPKLVKELESIYQPAMTKKSSR